MRGNGAPICATINNVELSKQSSKENMSEKQKKTIAAIPTTGDATMNWDEFENNTPAAQKEHDLTSYENSLASIAENEVTEGTVVGLNKREVIINVGFKSEGIVSINEFRYMPELAVGDKVEVYVENQEDAHGQLILSHRKARTLKAWDRVLAAYENQEIVKGYIKYRTKGGMIVDVFGIEAFLPGSQIDIRPIRDYDIFLDKTMEFKVVKINHEHKNIVVSHKALIEAELEQQRLEIISHLEKGQVLEGVVKNITSYGVFVDLGGVDGLVHITDLAWGRINHPSEVVELDQKLNVVILEYDPEKKRIALGIKQLTPHPWDSLDPNLKEGDTVHGKIVLVTDYGAFVEIAPGVEGLVHVSEISWNPRLKSASEFLKVGDEVDAKILALDRETRKMSLGIKQLKPDPWEGIEQRYPVGSRHVAHVRNFTAFGIFVEVEEGIDGLVHVSDLSWTKKIKHPEQFTKIGEPLEVVVLGVDKENRKLSLGHKQVEENPWEVFEQIFAPGTTHEGTILEVSDKGGTVALPYGLEGYATGRNLRKEDGTLPSVDEKLPFVVLEFNKNSHRIVLSHARTYQEATDLQGRKTKEDGGKEGQSMQRQIQNINLGQQHTTLGSIPELQQLHDEMKEKE